MATPLQQYEAFVAETGGSKVIRRLLVANNGMAARKFIMSIRTWLFTNFGDASLIHIISMATPEDLKANAMHLHSADAFYEVPGGSNASNFANVNLIVRLAKTHKCDAVWPGWGHASENPALPRTLESLGIIFIGPTDQSMFLLGDKIASTIIAQSADVPCVEWSGSGVTVTPDASGKVDVPDDAFAAACVNSAEEAVTVANKVGFPIMIKASEGGGGKGVRMAQSVADIPVMYQQVVDEVKGSPVFLMRLCTNARHIEIQLLSDKNGNISVLSGRDCSMQRRFQKIVEEGPPRTVAPETMRAMELAAARLAKLVEYTHAGTVEYLFIQETQQFYFLELNPRLQVEHPVTEGITGTNLPSLQLIVAMGCDITKLPAGQDISRFIVDPDDPGPFVDPFSKVDGHVVATRITAENAADGWKPTVGAINDIFFQSMPDVWGYFSVRTPAEVHAFADSQFGHVFAHGKTRAAACRLLSLTISRLRVVGEIHTNVTYVNELIQMQDFLENKVTTAWLDKIIAADKQLKMPSMSAVAICGALLKTHIINSELEAKIKKEFLWRNACPPPEMVASLVEKKIDFIWNGNAFAFEVFRHSEEIFTLSVNGGLAQAKLKPVPGGCFVVSYGSCTYGIEFEKQPGDKIRMMLDGVAVILEKEKDPTALQAPYGGKLTRYLVEDGTHVNRGDPWAEMEVMKMLFALPVAEAGVVNILKPPGIFVEAGEALGKLELDDPSIVAKAKPFDGDIGNFEPPFEMRDSVAGSATHTQMQKLVARCFAMLDGYVDNEDDVLSKLSELLLDPEVLLADFDELMAGPGSKLPQSPRDGLAALKPREMNADSFGAQVLEVLLKYERTLDETGKTNFRGAAEPVFLFAERYKGGMIDCSTQIISSLIEKFLDVERKFIDDRSDMIGVYQLNEAYPDDQGKVLQAVLSHNQLERKVSLLLNALDLLGTHTLMNPKITGLLKELSNFTSTKHVRVQRKAKQIVASAHDNLAEQSKEAVMPGLQKIAAGEQTDAEDFALISEMKQQLALCQPKLMAMLNISDKALRRAVTKSAVLLWYGQFGVASLAVKTYLRKGKEKAAVTWDYTIPTAIDSPADGVEQRFGILLVFSSMEDLESNFDDLCQLALSERKPLPESAEKPTADLAPKSPVAKRALSSSEPAKPAMPKACIHILVLGDNSTEKASSGPKAFKRSFAYAVMDELSTGKTYHKILSTKSKFLSSQGVAQVSVLLPSTDSLNCTSVFNFMDSENYDENRLLRHILPPQANQLELSRLCNFDVERCWFPDAPQTHVYVASAKKQPLDTRLFVRTLVLLKEATTEEEGIASLKNIESYGLPLAFSTLETAISDSRYKATESNHLFFKYTSPLMLTVTQAVKIVRDMLPAFSAEVVKMSATEMELLLPLWDPSLSASELDAAHVKNIRMVVQMAPSISIECYEESILPDGSIGLSKAGGTPVKLAPYALLSVVDQKRLKCQKLRTTFAPDFVVMYENAVQQVWDKASAVYPSLQVPEKKLISVELRLTKDGSKVEPVEDGSPPPAVGMMAWLLTMFTPECPTGRDIVMIANDITFLNGTFGPKEDIVFEKASQYARALGIPRIYMAANAGARFGLSDAVKKCFRVQWNDYDPAKGIAYLWLTDKDKDALGSAVVTEPVTAPVDPDDEEDEDTREEEKFTVHNKITCVIGTEEGLGVESLQGAGRIAAETSIANREIFTLGYCTARNIGIGSYVLRLGQRVIQQKDAPILLTGYQALNKLLGTSVYESNAQLGGPEVMGGNGVSHLLVDDDMQAIVDIVHWLSFVPKCIGAPLPCLPISDPIDRPAKWMPTQGVPYDPRLLLCGGVQDGSYAAGLLDRDSFVETLADWAKTVVCGRGRLGGIPVGVIVTENRLVEKHVLADPANLESKPQTMMQAGQVWFPDSAYKTSQAIKDFNAGEGLPLLLLANWRGFSGGRKDMFEEVLKFGSFIVDELTQFRQPIITYIPPHCEIRGGAWVVIDSTINPTYMEMYASDTARGGVLEPAGIAEIKFRKAEVMKTMLRVDKQLQWMSMNEASGVVRPEDIDARKNMLFPYYQPLGEMISDLHDRPERMLAKGVIEKIVPWGEARAFFYWRLKRRTREEELVRALIAAKDGKLSHAEALQQVAAKLPADVSGNDKACYEALL